MRTAIPYASEGGGDGSLDDSATARQPPLRRVTQLHSYDGKFHILPNNFVIPTLTLASFKAFFLVLKPQEGVSPFRLVKPVDLKESNKGNSHRHEEDDAVCREGGQGIKCMGGRSREMDSCSSDAIV